VSTTPRGPRVWLDHFVVAIDDLDVGRSEFEALTGVGAVYGGEHPTLGTHNALVSLGPDRYLEILSPRPGDAVHPMFGEAGGHSSLTPILWALATSDVSELHRIVGEAGFDSTALSPGSRVTVDDEILRWTMFMMGEGSPANAPFFIEWDSATRHPSTSSPEGCSLEAFEVSSADRGSLERLLHTVGFEARVVAGPTRTLISLATPRGPVTLGG